MTSRHDLSPVRVFGPDAERRCPASATPPARCNQRVQRIQDEVTVASSGRTNAMTAERRTGVSRQELRKRPVVALQPRRCPRRRQYAGFLRPCRASPADGSMAHDASHANASGIAHLARTATQVDNALPLAPDAKGSAIRSMASSGYGGLKRRVVARRVAKKLLGVRRNQAWRSNVAADATGCCLTSTRRRASKRFLSK